MSDKLVTVATFSTPTEANIVRNQLNAEGILAFLADEAMVGMAWHLGNAVGGVKLQVAEDDVERAMAVIQTDGPALITGDGAGEDRSTSPADDMAPRAFRAAVIGLLVLPLQLYPVWLLVRLALDGTLLDRENLRLAVMTFILDLPVLIVCSVLLRAIYMDWIE